MGLLSDKSILDRIRNMGMILPEPSDELREEGVLSYGVSSYGFDATLGDEVYSIEHIPDSIDVANEIDPKNFVKDSLARRLPVFNDMNGGEFIRIPAHGFALAHTNEYFKIPRDCLVVCVGKSSYARCGLIVNVTPLEPEWQGQVTLELHNTTGLPMRVYVNEGVCQFLFLKGDSECEISYSDRKGKYNGQKGVTFPKVRKKQGLFT